MGYCVGCVLMAILGVPDERSIVMSEWVLTCSVRHDNGYGYDSYETTGTYVGRGEFYSGVRRGDEVTVCRESHVAPEGCVEGHDEWAVSVGGAWLHVQESDVQVS